MKVVVFGGGGFIGSHLTEYLINENYKVVVIDIDSQKIPEKCLSHENFSFMKIDIYIKLIVN